ncbi:MAG: class I SAM-dependent methyltransferase [Bdellovibrionales bacterium]|nr:class I SAM-dependent methyltransferase [Bdellovibrionales bacterium]
MMSLPKFLANWTLNFVESFNYPNEGINIPVRKYIESLGNLAGKKVLDCPAGDGRATYLFRKKGAEVVSADLYPEFFKLEGACQYIDLADPLPFADAEFDFVICQEGIEHMQDQLGVFKEFHRVLKPQGTLFLTTPSLSHIRARLSQLLTESDYWKRQAPSELDSIWFSNKSDNRMYFGHIFLLTISKLRTLAVLSGFQIQKRHRSELGTTSIFLLPIVGPIIFLTSLLSYWHSRIKFKYSKSRDRLRIAKEIYSLNASFQTMICKDIIVELKKGRTSHESFEYLKNL